MSVPPEVGPEEELGRSVFSHRHANRALRSTVPHHVFLTRAGENRISVDRLSVAPQSRRGWALLDAARDKASGFSAGR